MIVCPRCSKENQDHYKFCLGCGSELPREAAHAPKNFTAPTPPAGIPIVAAPVAAPARSPSAQSMELATTQAGGSPVAGAPLPAAAKPSAQPVLQTLSCPTCGNAVPFDFKFCGTCGHRMDDAPAAAPAPKAAPAVAPQSDGAVKGQLVLINPDGTEGDSFPLTNSTSVGRDVGGVFAADAYLSPLHATFSFVGEQLIVRDENSLNGVYVKVDHDSPVKLEPGSIFRIGQEILRFESIASGSLVNGVETMGSPNPGYIGRLCLVIGREGSGNAFPIPADGMHIGRERGDVVFPEDGYVSGLHCRIHRDGKDVFLTDVGSSNGTFTRVTGQQALRRGELLLMGQQLFRAQY